MTCTFFGHRDIIASSSIYSNLQDVLLDLITDKGVDNFLVGYQGCFDGLVLSVLKKLKEEYTFIRITVVLAYLTDVIEDCETIYPEGLENVPLRFAISVRNRIMVDNSEYVVTFVTRDFGGASQFKNLALRKGKTVIEISERYSG